MARHFQISVLLICSLVSFTFCMFTPRITSQQKCQKQKRNNPVSQFWGQKSCLIQENRERRILGYWIQNQYLAPVSEQLIARAIENSRQIKHLSEASLLAYDTQHTVSQQTIDRQQMAQTLPTKTQHNDTAMLRWKHSKGFMEFYRVYSVLFEV